MKKLKDHCNEEVSLKVSQKTVDRAVESTLSLLENEMNHLSDVEISVLSKHLEGKTPLEIATCYRSSSEEIKNIIENAKGKLIKRLKAKNRTRH